MDDRTSVPGAAEMKAAQALTTKVLAIGSWTAKATPEKRPADYALGGARHAASAIGR
jgi:hypothetical protein